MIDLKRRLGGDFYVIETTPRRIVLGNSSSLRADLALPDTERLLRHHALRHAG